MRAPAVSCLISRERWVMGQSESMLIRQETEQAVLGQREGLGHQRKESLPQRVHLIDVEVGTLRYLPSQAVHWATASLASLNRILDRHVQSLGSALEASHSKVRLVSTSQKAHLQTRIGLFDPPVRLLSRSSKRCSPRSEAIHSVRFRISPLKVARIACAKLPAWH